MTTEANRISRKLSQRIGERRFDMWFRHAGFEVDGSRLDVAARNRFVADWIGTNFRNDLQGVAQDALGDHAEISVRVDPERCPRTEQVDGPATAPAPGDPTSSDAPAGPPSVHGRTDGADRAATSRRPRTGRGPALRRLEDFVVGPSNRLAHAAAERFAEDAHAASLSPLFIHGTCGVGKTHLLQGICRRFARRCGRPSVVRYVTGEQFTNEYITSIKNRRVDEFRLRMRRLELLAIDDVHFLSNKERTQSEFLCTLDEINLTGARIVLASDEHPRLIRQFSEGLVNRFLSGMVLQVDRPDRDVRIELIRRLADQRMLRLNDAAVDEVASRCTGSVREIEGAISKLSALSMLATGHDVAEGGGQAIGLGMVRELFTDALWTSSIPVRLETILAEVCTRTGVPRTDVLGSSRHRRVVLARSLSAWLARDMTTQSYPEIAHALGRSCHSSVHSATRRLQKQLDESATVAPDGTTPVALRELVDQLRHSIRRATT